MKIKNIYEFVGDTYEKCKNLQGAVLSMEATFKNHDVLTLRGDRLFFEPYEDECVYELEVYSHNAKECFDEFIAKRNEAYEYPDRYMDGTSIRAMIMNTYKINEISADYADILDDIMSVLSAYRESLAFKYLLHKSLRKYGVQALYPMFAYRDLDMSDFLSIVVECYQDIIKEDGTNFLDRCRGNALAYRQLIEDFANNLINSFTDSYLEEVQEIRNRIEYCEGMVEECED